MVAPARERGLKWHFAACIYYTKRRSREGAWIEINFVSYRDLSGKCRSREGAWIEIAALLFRGAAYIGRSREGAWIEISSR